jgi:hypothetical protein
MHPPTADWVRYRASALLAMANMALAASVITQRRLARCFVFILFTFRVFRHGPPKSQAPFDRPLVIRHPPVLTSNVVG